MEKRVGDFSTGSRNDPPERWAGDVHFRRGLFLLVPFEVGKPQCFELVQGKENEIKARERNSQWFERRDSQTGVYVSCFAGTGHGQVMSLCS